MGVLAKNVGWNWGGRVQIAAPDGEMLVNSSLWGGRE